MSFSISNFLLKKTLGAPNSNSQSTDISGETPGVTLPKIISNTQLNSYPIPSAVTKTILSAPKDTIKYTYSNTTVIPTITYTDISLVASTSSSASDNPDLEFTGYINNEGLYSKQNNPTKAYGLIFTSKTYPWIQYVDRLQISTAILQTPAYSFGPSPLLSNAIPSNFDPKGSYSITVTPSSGKFKIGATEYSNVPASEYIIDKDAGYIYFTKFNWNGIGLTDITAIPLISFYRYNGAMGIPTNLGNFAGAYVQDPTAIAIGNNAGYTGQGANALAIGNYAGAYGQGTGSIAIGTYAGYTGMKQYSIAIGAFAGPTGLTANSIVLNASGTGLAGAGPTGGFYVAPVASYSGSTGPFMLLAYGADRQIVCVTGAALTAMNISSGGGGGGGSSNPDPQLVTLGLNAGTTGAVNIGFNAGRFTQGTGSIAIGYNAGPTGQGGVTGSSYKTSWVASTATGSNHLIYSAMSSNGQYQIMPNNNSDGGFYYTTNGNMANPTWIFKSAPASITRIVLISDVNKNAVMLNSSYGYSADFETAANFSISSLSIGTIVAAKGSFDLSTILATTYQGANGYYLRLGTVSNTSNLINITPQLTSISSSNLYVNNNTTIGLSKDGNVCITALSTGVLGSINLPGSSLYFTSILKLSTANAISYTTGYSCLNNANGVTVITLTSSNSNIKVGMYISYTITGSITGTNIAFVTAISPNNTTITLSVDIIPSGKSVTSIIFRTFAILDNTAPLPNYSVTNKSANEWKVVALSGQSTNNTYYMLVGGFNTFVYLGIYNTSAYLPTFTKTSLPQANWQSYTISATGQYMYALTTTGMIYYSDSYGDSWTSYAGPSDTSYNTGVLSLSDNGMYGLMTNNSAVNPIYNFNTVYTNTTGNALAFGTNAGQTNQGAGSVAIGTAAGQTETALSYGSFASSKWFTAVPSSSNINSVACSASGQIQLYGRDKSGSYNPYISKDSGQTFSIISAPDLLSITITTNIYAISADGNTIVIVGLVSPNTIAFISPNAGASFPIRYRLGTETARAVAVSGEGQYIIIITSLGVYFSNNFGRTFTNVFSGTIMTASCAISYTGQYISTIINGNYYVSNTYAFILPSIYLPFESISGAGTTIDGINILTNIGVATNSSIKKIGANSAAFGSNNYLIIPMDPSATSFTICCWVYFNSVNPSSGAGVIFSLYNNGDTDTASLADVFLSGSTIYSNINKFGTITGGNITGPSIAAATWYHIALTFNYNGGSNGTYIVYVNGTIAGQRTTGALSTGYFFPNQLFMGRTSAINNNQFIDGYVDDFRYYKSVLNASQISTIYGLTTASALPRLPTLFTFLTANLYLPFESISGTDIDGVVVNTNNGPVARNTSIKKIGSSSAAFNGSNYIVTPVKYNIGSGFTICCWVYFANLNRQFIWCLSAGYTNAYGAFIHLFLGNNDNTINLVYYGSTTHSITYTIPSLAINTWYHFSISFNQNGTTTLYVNGSSVGTFTASDSSLVASWAGSTFINNYPNSPNNQVIVIGTNSWTGDPGFFNGYIDDFHHYEGMLSASQITQIYNTTTTTVANTLTVSPSGQYQVYTSSVGVGYLSTNFGASYSVLVTPTNINSLVISQNGQILAYNDGVFIYYSSNQGASWFTINPTALTTPVSLAMSADGSYFITASTSAVYTLNTDAAGNSVAIGTNAGQTNQSVNAIAIGNMAGQINQPANTIVLNASGTALNPTVTNGCFIAPIATQANSTSAFFNLLMYGSDNQVVQSNNLKMDATGNFTSGSITSGEITSSITTEISQLRLLSTINNNNKYGVLLRYDGWDFYMLRTNANDPYGGWSNDPSGSIDRPFRWSLDTGKIIFGAGIVSNISASLTDSPSFPALSLSNINIGFNTAAIDFYPHINGGSFNNIVETGDFAIINKDQSVFAGISFGTWGGTAGLRVGYSTVKITSPGVLITTSNMLINTTDFLNLFRIVPGFTQDWGTGINFYGGSSTTTDVSNNGFLGSIYACKENTVLARKFGYLSFRTASDGDPVEKVRISSSGLMTISGSGINAGLNGFAVSNGSFVSGGYTNWNATANVGLLVMNAIVTRTISISSTTFTTSDIRIKKNIQTCTHLLNKIDKLRVVSYDYIENGKGSVNAGIIAQELSSVYPNSVIPHSSTLPNIFSLAITHAQLENGLISIKVNYTQSVDITEGSTVHLIIQKTGNNQEITHENLIVNLTSNSFDIKAWDNYNPSDKVFVYGTKVENFLTINNTELSMIALGGLKELYQHVKVLQAPDITVGNRIDPTVDSFKLVYDTDKSNLVIGSSVNGFVNKQFVMHKNAPSNSLLITADGTIYNNGTFVSSDRRIKTGIEPISDEECLAKINRLNVVKYNYTNPALNGANKVIGFIAQEVREAIPEAVDIATKNIYWSNAFSFTVGQSNTAVDSTYTSLSDKAGKTYTITNGVVYDASNTAVFYFRDNVLVSVHSTPTRDADGKLLYSTSTTYDLSKDDTYVLHTHSVYKQTDVMISVATVDVIVGNIVRFVYNNKKYEGVVMTVDPAEGAGASTLKVVTPDIFTNGTLQTYEKVIQDFHMLSKEKIFALTVGAIQDLTAMNSNLKTQVGSLQSQVGSLQSQVGSLQSQVGSLQSQVGSLQSQLSSLMTWATSQGFTGASA
jgi:chaperonin cofactor prefoldin